MNPVTPEELSELSSDCQRFASDVLTRANQTSSRDAEEHCGTLMVSGRDMYWNSDDESEDSLQDYLDQL